MTVGKQMPMPPSKRPKKCKPKGGKKGGKGR